MQGRIDEERLRQGIDSEADVSTVELDQRGYERGDNPSRMFNSISNLIHALHFIHPEAVYES